ncbi:HpcH/HpaI aldolase family protein [Spirosoma utsteinense]|uniref:2-dehydro-3-deoxyglucarate aldolase/4-hydroxy-2-oxoheptanedioate aldolase n=1 Tax=Spirosoma utsteinense TaxID=2585773 RepID=A0ABR6W747_9BACT|nr:aldolase/citrate lyase family protein [Spirosoma utsteinense]MBC3788577.1 2-dehydro-3-deoxyglucarate aldolase/4-hydroxy-2-oxoheptanedioate aldolase [Spirosoma utsteinense]MBC3791816.1 2-dehydro-3-deoxyglucarate aldolase/4-hydroxy-2-oxoheptanedioate aldolase [Spirosoma utsteinense]
MKTTFTEKLRGSRPLLGTIVSLPSPELSELLSLAGFDWLFIDMEHGPLSIGDAQRLLQAVKNDCNAIVRVAENNPILIKQALDIGADGIIVPLVNSAEEARQAVASARYPPLGKRSVGLARAHDYGLHFADYIQRANQTLAVIIQIEHQDAVNNLDEILAVEGIDGVFIGPYDLSGSMNRLGDVFSAPVQEAIAEVKSKCARKNIPVGIFLQQPDQLEAEIASGTTFLAVGTDTFFVWSGAQNVVNAFKAGLAR